MKSPKGPKVAQSPLNVNNTPGEMQQVVEEKPKERKTGMNYSQIELQMMRV